MYTKLWIDDVRTPPDASWLWAKTPGEALRFILDDAHAIDTVSFDHDLGEDVTSIPVAETLETWAYIGFGNPLDWSIHSANPVGRMNLTTRLTRATDYWNARQRKAG